MQIGEVEFLGVLNPNPPPSFTISPTDVVGERRHDGHVHLARDRIPPRSPISGMMSPAAIPARCSPAKPDRTCH
jgi:hypothetical protein